MTACPICGKSYKEIRELRPCPLHNNALICGTEHCIGCEHHNDDVLSSIWCQIYAQKDTGRGAFAENKITQRIYQDNFK